MIIGISNLPTLSWYTSASYASRRETKNKVSIVKFKVTFIKQEISSEHITLSVSSPRLHTLALPKEMLIWVVKLQDDEEELSRKSILMPYLIVYSMPQLVKMLTRFRMGEGCAPPKKEHKLVIQFSKSQPNAFIAWFIRGHPKLTTRHAEYVTQSGGLQPFLLPLYLVKESW